MSNAADVFTGWSDPPLSELGAAQARGAAAALRALSVRPTCVHTSLLRRSIATAQIVLDRLGLGWIPVHRSWRLNERHYGDLTGQDERAVAARVDGPTFRAWRRSFAVAPPAMSERAAAAMYADDRYRHLPPGLPGGGPALTVMSSPWATAGRGECGRGGHGDHPEQRRKARADRAMS